MPTATAPARRRTRELEPLAGLSAIDAIARLRALELRPAIEPCESAPGDHGLVLAQEPGAGAEVCRGQLITLLIGEHADRAEAVGERPGRCAPPRREQAASAHLRPLAARALDTRSESTEAPRPAGERELRRPADPARDRALTALVARDPPIEPLPVSSSLREPADDAEARDGHGDRAVAREHTASVKRLRSARILIATALLLTAALLLVAPSLVSLEHERSAARSAPRAAPQQSDPRPASGRRIAGTRPHHPHQAVGSHDSSRGAPPASVPAPARAHSMSTAPAPVRSYDSAPSAQPDPVSPIGPVPGPPPSP